jgi:hypothetical protein
MRRDTASGSENYKNSSHKWQHSRIVIRSGARNPGFKTEIPAPLGMTTSELIYEMSSNYQLPISN